MEQDVGRLDVRDGIERDSTAEESRWNEMMVQSIRGEIMKLINCNMMRIMGICFSVM